MTIRQAPIVFLTTAIFLLGITSGSAHAQQPDSAAVRAAFDSLVTAHTYHLTLKDGDLQGQGAEWLVEQGRAAHHFMIGERHGTAEIPAFIGSLYERLKPVGYDYAALEIGPFAAQRVNATLRRGGFDALSDFHTRYDAPPVAFLYWTEEAQMAARIAEKGGAVWGLDQEFTTSLPFHLDALAEQAETDRERAAVKTARDQMRGEWASEQEYLGNADPSALQALRRAFEERGDEKALSRIDALITSNEIYAPYTRGTGFVSRSSVKRENYMKRILVDSIRAVERRAGESPKVLYKFGALHTSQNPAIRQNARIPLGTFVSEWARTIRGEKSYHVFVDCRGGKNQPKMKGPTRRCVPALTGPARAQGTTSPFSAHLRGDHITVIDLTPLRPRVSDWTFLTERARAVILAVDAYVSIPNVTPATRFELDTSTGTSQ